MNMYTNGFFPVNWWQALEISMKAAIGMEAVGFIYEKALLFSPL